MLEGQLEGQAGRGGWKAPEWAVSIAAGSYFWAPGRRGGGAAEQTPVGVTQALGYGWSHAQGVVV